MMEDSQELERKSDKHATANMSEYHGVVLAAQKI
jgi:hypothetical protein